jgi:hypothetical protein
MKRLSGIVAVAAISVGLAVPSGAVAKNTTTCTFEKGTTTCITVQGSHGSTSEHQGSEGSNGVSKNPPAPCKETGSDQTDTCE